HRTATAPDGVPTGLEYRLIPSPGYQRNVGVGRLWDHLRLAWNLRIALRNASPPDACLVGYPPIETASVMIDWLAARDVPVLLDVKDQWPELFLDPVPAPLRSFVRPLLAPYYAMARR